MNKLKLNIQFFADDCTELDVSDNELKIYVKQLKREVEALSETTEATLLLHDGKIAELCNYITTNLSNSLRCLLDSLIASGELDSIIKDLLSISKYYTCNSVGEMKLLYVSEGSLVQTLGYHSANDGGASLYHVRSLKTDDVIDEGSIIMLSNSLVAELIVDKGIINVKQFGAYGDNEHDDTEAFKNANKCVISKAQKEVISNQSIHTTKAILEIPHGKYLVKGSNVLGSILEDNTIDTNTIGYKVIGNNSSIIWDVEKKDDCLFYFDNSISSPVIEDLEILTLNNRSSVKTNYGDVFKIVAPVINGQNYGDVSGGEYRNVRVVGIRNNKYIANTPQTIFNVSGNVMCDQTHVVNCNFVEFNSIMKSNNSQAVNWVFDRISAHTSLENACYFDIEKCNDNFIVQNSCFSIRATQTILKAMCKLGSSNKLTERGDYHFTFKDNRIEIISGISGNSYYPVYINYGNVVIENTNFLLGGYSQTANPIFYLESHGSLVLRNSNLAKPTLVIPSVDNSISGLGNFIGHSLIVEDCIHNGYTLKYNFDGELCDYMMVIQDMYKPLRKAIFKNFNKLATFRSDNFEIVGNSKPSSSRNYLSHTNNSGVAFGEEILLPPHQTITKVILHTRGTLPATTKKIRVYFGDVSSDKYKDVEIDSTIVNSNKIIFDGLASIISNDVSKQTIKVYPIKANGEVDGYQIISTIDVEYMPCSPYSHFYKTNTSDAIYVL